MVNIQQGYKTGEVTFEDLSFFSFGEILYRCHLISYFNRDV